MAEYTHGGDIISAQKIFGSEILDFSASLNPLGMPPEIRSAIKAAAEESDKYPDYLCRELIAGIAKRDGVEREQVLCGNGAADLMFRLVFAEKPKRAMIIAPTFSEYEQALKAVDCEVIFHILGPDRDFELTADVFDALTDDLDMLFLCNPNSPTGRTIDARLLEEIADSCQKRGILLVVDECFIELADGAVSLVKKIDNMKNVFLLRAFTKSYCMAGLRLGYCLASRADILERMRLVAQPWSVSHPAQRAGLAALNLPNYPAKARIIIAEERDFISSELKRLNMHVFPSSVNFILFRAEGATDLRENMLKRGVLIRSCGNFRGLTDDYYRVAVKCREDNIKLINELRGCCNWQGQ